MKKIFRFATVLAIAGAALLTGCTKDFSSDIDALDAKLTKLINDKFGELQSKIDAGCLISKVEPFTTPEPGGVKISFTGSTPAVTIYNGSNGKDADTWEIKDGFWVKNGTPTTMRAVPVEWTIGSDGYWYKDGKKTSVKAEGSDGSSAAEWSIIDGYWAKNGVKTSVKAEASDGNDGANGSYWKPDTDKKLWVEYDGKGVATGNTIPLYASESGSSTGGGITAIWDKEEGYISFSGVEGIETPVKIELTKPLKGLAFVPERIFDGLGLITAYEVYAPAKAKADDATGKVKGFPTLDRETEGEFLTTAPIPVSYRANPQNIKVEDYDWDFINRKVFTKSEEDDDDLVTLVTGPKAHGSHYDFTIKLNKAVKEADHNQTNDIVALRAIAKEATLLGEKEHIVSDYAYIENKPVKDFYIIHKDGEFLYEDAAGKDVVYEANYTDDPKYYRWEEFVKITDDTDYNSGAGIATPAPGTGTNPAAIALPYNGTVDLLDYVETYSLESKDLASTLGITPEYTFEFAGLDEAKNEFLHGTDPDKIVYLSDDLDKTNQNKFIKFDGSKISVNEKFVTLLTPAANRTPLIYVQSKYNGKLLAECLIKIQIVEEEAPTLDAKGWDVFIWHNVTFPNELPATATYTGKSGTVKAPHLAKDCEGNRIISKDDKDLNVTWPEVNQWVLDAKCVNMSYLNFNKKYDLENPKLILTEDGKEPQALPASKDKATLVDPADINTYYSASGSGLAIDKLSPVNWDQNTNIIDLKIDKTFVALNDYDVHHVFVLFEALDNNENIDVIVQFTFKVEPHVHDFTILKKYNDKTFWILNPDYIQGPQDLLIEPKPAADAYYGKGGLDAPDQYKTYGAVKVKGLEEDLRSAFVEHFKEYANCWKNANEESIYVFKIYNYKNDVVDIVDGDASAVKGDEDGYATVTIAGADLKKMADVTSGVQSPYILVKKPAGLSVGKDILVQVTELCSSVAGTAVKDLKAADYGKTYVQAYYYVLFEAIKPTVKFNKVELGDFQVPNDYATASEIVAGVYESDASDAVALFEWDADAKTWKLGPSAATYGLTDPSKISFKINKLIYGKNDKDTEDSFKERLSIFVEGQTLDPWPQDASGSKIAMTECGIDWRNDGTNLELDKVAGFELEVFYDEESLTKGEGEVTVIHTGGKAHPNHHEDGTFWE